MVKRLILITSILLLISCGSRKVNVSKGSSETKSDSTVVIKIDGTSVKENNVFINEQIDETEYKPIDSLKPMIINGKEFVNVIVKAKKSNKKTIDTTKQKTTIKIDKKVDVKKEDKKESSVKSIDKKQNYLNFIWLLVPIFLFYLLYKYTKLTFPVFR